MSNDDWQETAFTTRHMHNRASRASRGSKSVSTFDVRKTYGAYEVKCPAWSKLDTTPTDAADDADATLQLYRLTGDQRGVVGELRLPGVMHAAVVMAGSREGMRRVLEGLEPGRSGEKDEEDGEDEEDEEDGEDEEDEEKEEDDEEEDPFQKNSFRTPKFWIKWKAIPPPPAKRRFKKVKRWTKEVEDEEGEEVSDDANGASSTMVKGEGGGYVVFTGNMCRKFKGTISCEEMGWRDVAFSGFKEVGRSERDVGVLWGEVEM